MDILILIGTILTWLFIPNLWLKIGIVACVFIYAEVKRKRRQTTKILTITQIISAIVFVAGFLGAILDIFV